MTPMIIGLTGEKMSSSEKDSKIDLLDTDSTLIAKINEASCEPNTKDPKKGKKIEKNGVLSLLKYIIFPLFEPGKGLEIKREEKNGGEGDVEYKTYEQVDEAFDN